MTRRALLMLALLCAPLGCSEGSGSGGGPSDARPASLAAWKAQRERLDRTVWADERLAQEHEGTLVSLWDALLAARDQDALESVRVLSSIGFETLEIGSPRRGPDLELDIESYTFGAPHQTLSAGDWARRLEDLVGDGLRLVQSEWHHADFTPGADAAPARSLVAIALHLEDVARQRRIVVDGNLAVEWSERRDERGHPLPGHIDATGLRMLARGGPLPFERILSRAWKRGGARLGVHPVLLYDLDRDGHSDIVSIGARRVLFNRGDATFRGAPLLEHPYALTEAGAIGDLDGDGHPDLVSTRARGDLVVYRGDERGRFRGEPLVTQLDEPLRAPSAIALGDVDADGDLDLWLAQYKPAYLEGQMPSPFFDANDGHPSHLLLNDGAGNLATATESAGLAAKRFRRSYASSFIDLDDDTDLDLLVVSDYSGVDLYENDGRGRFADANHLLRGDRHLFGMSTAFGDFDLDGRLDFFVAGMGSTTARRLESLGLGRDDREEVTEMRMRMAFGNRMFLARDGGFEEPDFRGEVARTGWTWGTTALDFDNDGDRDLFAANGHVSGESTQDYCSNFWTHDIYDGGSSPDPALASLFSEEGLGLTSGATSWDGYQKNQLLMNQGGRGFTNVAFLLGVADEFDSRSALSEDLDGDGRVDLVVVEDHGAQGQKLHVYRNRLATNHHWIGVRLQEQGVGVSPVGASVVVRTPEQSHVGRIVTGETLMGQHSTTLHFGLGESPRVDSIEVRWVDGRTTVLSNPEPNRYHRILAPEHRAVPPPAAPTD